MNLRTHWPFLILAIISAALLFTNLGPGYLWADEGDTAVLSRNIVKSGLPRAWDGITFMDSDFGARVNDDLVMVSSPWLQYYFTAASFFLFGENTLSARLPFAIAGWLTVLIIYRLVWVATADRRAAIGASILTICSVQFLLFARQARYYAVAMLLTCLLIDTFLRMRSLGRAVLFALVAVFLFHTHPIGIAPVFAMGVLTLINDSFSPQRRWFWITCPVILALTVPWLGLAHTGYTENASLVSSFSEFFIRSTQYLIECSSVAPVIGVIVLLITTLVTSFWKTSEARERELLLTIFCAIVSYAIATAVTQRTAALWVTGVRYTSAVIPLLAIAAAVLMLMVSRARNSTFVLLLLVFAFTKFAQITPWTFWAEREADPEKRILALHVPVRTFAAFFPTEDFLFLRDLRETNLGTLGQCIAFLREHADPSDLVITNYESEPLYFHTRLRQGMKIMRQDPIYDVARRRGLPEYLFGVDHARWAVWRFNWDDYLGIHWKEVAEHLLADGAQISDVAEIKETAWENRENLHFHRFAGGIYLFPQDTNLAAAHIFKVDWPGNL